MGSLRVILFALCFATVSFATRVEDAPLNPAAAVVVKAVAASAAAAAAKDASAESLDHGHAPLFMLYDHEDAEEADTDETEDVLLEVDRRAHPKNALNSRAKAVAQLKAAALALTEAAAEAEAELAEESASEESTDEAAATEQEQEPTKASRAKKHTRAHHQRFRAQSSQSSAGSSGSSGSDEDDAGPVYILPLAPMSWATLPAQPSPSQGGAGGAAPPAAQPAPAAFIEMFAGVLGTTRIGHTFQITSCVNCSF